MVICAVVSCKNNPDNTVGVSFHRFPNAQKKKDLYSKWIHAVNRVNPVSTSSTIDKLWTPNYHSVVCSEHFTPDSFTKNPCIVDSMNLTGFRVRTKARCLPQPSSWSTSCHPMHQASIQEEGNAKSMYYTYEF